MEERLPPLAAKWADYEEHFHEVAHKVRLTRGFVFLPIVAGPDLAHALAQWLAQAGYPVTTLDLVGDAEWQRLAANLLDLSPPPDGVVIVIGRDSKPQGVAGALALVNRARDAIAKRLARPLLWCGPWPFLNLTREHAHDLWSVHAVPQSMLLPSMQSIDEAPAPDTSPGFEIHAVSAAELAPPAPAPAPPAESLARLEVAAAAPPARFAAAIVSRKTAARPVDPTAAILMLRDAEAALARKDALAALRITNNHLDQLDPEAGDLHHKLVVLRARALSQLGRDEEACGDLDALLKEPALPPDVELDAVLERGHLTLRSGNLRAAKERFKRAKQLAGAVKSPEKGVLARIGLGLVAMHRNRSEEAGQLLSQAVLDAMALGDEDLLQAARDAHAALLNRTHDSQSAQQLMTRQPFLSHEELLELHRAAVSAGLDPAKLAAPLPRPLVATFPRQDHPHDQIWTDLGSLNKVGRMAGGGAPLRSWLLTAAELCGRRSEAAVFRGALARLEESQSEAKKREDESDNSISMAPSSDSPTDRGVTPEPRGRVPYTVMLHADIDRMMASALHRHITLLLRAGLTDWWSCDDIPAGGHVDREVAEHLARADVVVVLVSADLLSSPMMRWAIEAHRLGKRVVPVLVGPADLKGTIFERMPLLPRDGQPISVLRSSESALAVVANTLRGIYEQMR